MKRKLPLILLALLACALLFALPLSPEAHADIASGVYDGVPWVITDDGELLIGTDGAVTQFATDAGARLPDGYTWYGSKASVTSVRFLGTVYGNGCMRGMFDGYTNLLSADLRNFRAGYGTNPSLEDLFFGCTALTSVQFGGATTAGVQSLHGLLRGCSSLTSLNLSNLDTASATNMQYMFSGCSHLSSLNISGFTMTNVTELGAMFQGCTSLSSLSLPNLYTTAAPSCYDMFNGCQSLTVLDLSSLNLNGTVTNMFYNMPSLQKLTLGAYNHLDTDTNFVSLSHPWGVSDEGYATARTAYDTATAFPSGTGRTFQRVIQVNYDMSGAVPVDAYAVVPFSGASNYALYSPVFASTPYQQEFKCWEDPNTDNKNAGEAVNLLSYNNDILTFTAKWRPEVSWTWPSSSEAIATVLSTGEGVVCVPVFLSDTSTCTAAGESTYLATATFTAGAAAGETYTSRAEFFTAPHHNLVHHGAVAPKCTVAGNIEYWNCTRGCGQYFTDAGGTTVIAAADVVVPATGHIWAAPSYTWAANNRSVQARRVCTKDASHVETETRAATAAVTKPATCTEMGQTTYTAVFNNAAFGTQTRTLENIPALGHAWGQPGYAWSEDNRAARALRICGNDNNHREEETVLTTVQTLAPTCTTAGVYRYTAVFTNPAFPAQEKLVTGDPALGHDLLRHAPVEATCTETGLVEYWSCLNCGDFFADADGAEEIPDHNSVITPALGHSYLEEWASDETGHWHNCERCGARTLVYSHVPDHIPTVEAPARCVECGYVLSPALVVQSHAYFGETGDLGLGTVTYTKTKILDDDWVVELPEQTPKEEGQYFEGWLSSSDIRTHIPGTQLPFTFTDRKSVIIRGLWTQIIGEGHYDLGADTRYRFDEGSYTVSGDSTVYLGEQPFYPAFGGSLDVTNAG